MEQFDTFVRQPFAALFRLCFIWIIANLAWRYYRQRKRGIVFPLESFHHAFHGRNSRRGGIGASIEDLEMKKIILVTLCLFASFQVAAQDKAAAEAVMLQYAAATKSYDTVAMTRLMHPEALQVVHTTFDAALHGPKSDLAKKQLLPMFAVTSVDAFSALSDAETFKRMNDTIAKGAPELIDLMSTATYEIVGSFVKDDTAYVTYNLTLTVDGRTVTTQVVQTLKVHDGQWLLMLSSTSEAAIAGVKAQFE